MDLLESHRVSVSILFLEAILVVKVRLPALEIFLPHFCDLEGVSQVGSLNNFGPILGEENRTAFFPLLNQGEVAIVFKVRMSSYHELVLD